MSISAFGQLNLGTSVGITGPTGPLGTGLYDVVYDECQDGRYTPGQDAMFIGAFRVVVPVDAPVIDLGDTKNTAAKIADAADAAQKVWKSWGLIKGVNKIWNGDTSTRETLKTSGGLLALVNDQETARVGKSISLWASYNPIALPGINVATVLGQLGQMSRLIANDPLDPAYDQVTTIAPAPTAVLAGQTSDVAIDADATNAGVVTTALQQGLLHALERYQGAATAKNGYWATVHAREIAQFAGALDRQMLDLGNALNAAASADQALPALDPDLIAQLMAAKTGITDIQRRDLRNAGLSASEVSAFEKAAKEFDPTITASTIRAQADTITTALNNNRPALTRLAGQATAAAQTLQQDPNTGTTPPTASAGGPYTTTEGATVTLNAAVSTGGIGTLTYRWELTGDGKFDDATGPSPTVPAGAVGTRIISVEVTDSTGQRAVSNAVLSVTSSQPPVPTTTPAPSVRIVSVGQKVDFSVSTSQPVQWILDGDVAGTGSTFTYTPTRLADTGIHAVAALVGQPSGRRVQLNWRVLAQATDADGDSWRANVDCNDGAAMVHPGQPEIPHNGIDDDCDPLTVDGGGQETGTSFAYPDFANLTGLSLNGATQVGPVLRLTDGGGQEARSVWASSPINPSASFSSTFDVSLHDGGDTPADGIVFALQATPQGTAAVGAAGGGLAYLGVTPSVAIEFDTYQNGWDPSPNHVAVDLNGTVDTPTVIAESPVPLHGSPFSARVDYDATTTTLTVYIGQNGTTPATPLLSTKVDIAATLGTTNPGYAGFTSSTGGKVEVGDLLNWRFTAGQGTGAAARVTTVPELSLTTTAGKPVSATLKASTASGTSPTFAVTEQPLHGTVIVIGDQLTYTPNPDFVGSDTLAYAATASTNGQASAPALVHITVGAAPGGPSINPITPIQVDRAVITRDVIATAPGASTITLMASGLPMSTSFQDLGGGRGLITVDPKFAAPGTYQGTITAVSDGGTTSTPVQITIAGNRAPIVTNVRTTTPYQTPVTITAAATDPDGDVITYSVRSQPANGSVTVAGNRFTYQPQTGYSGTDGFVFAASDGKTSTAGSAIIAVTAPTPCSVPGNGIGQADLAITAIVPTWAKAGKTFDMTITVCNAGPATANLISTTLTLPLGLRVTKGLGGVIGPLGHNVTYLTPTLTPRASSTYPVTVTVDQGTHGTQTLTAATASATLDLRLLNNVLLKQVTVI